MLDLSLVKRLYAINKFHGSKPEEINYLKQKFGQIPQVLEEFYLKAGNTDRLNHGQDTWIMPKDYKKYTWLEDFIEGIVLLNENQGNCQAYIRNEDLSLPDPPVYVWYGYGGNEEPHSCTRSLSEFIIAASAYEAAFTLEYNPEDFYYVSSEDYSEFESRFNKYPFKLTNWISYDIEITFYNNDPYNLIAALYCESAEDDGSQLIYGAVNEEAYNKLEKALEGICEPF
ncbi:MAG: hypothetical protein K1W24_01445 [Lachnospiraceae bacterium]